MAVELAHAALVLAALVVVVWALRSSERQQGASHRTIEALVDHLRSRDAIDAASASATRENGRLAPRQLAGAPSPVPQVSQDPTGLMGDVGAGRAAMRAKGYDPDKPEDVNAWEEALGPSPFGGSR